MNHIAALPVVNWTPLCRIILQEQKQTIGLFKMKGSKTVCIYPYSVSPTI